MYPINYQPNLYNHHLAILLRYCVYQTPTIHHSFLRCIEKVCAFAAHASSLIHSNSSSLSTKDSESLDIWKPCVGILAQHGTTEQCSKALIDDWFGDSATPHMGIILQV